MNLKKEKNKKMREERLEDTVRHKGRDQEQLNDKVALSRANGFIIIVLCLSLRNRELELVAASLFLLN